MPFLYISNLQLSQVNTLRSSQLSSTMSEERPLRDRIKLAAGEKLDLLPAPLLRKVMYREAWTL